MQPPFRVSRGNHSQLQARPVWDEPVFGTFEHRAPEVDRRAPEVDRRAPTYRAPQPESYNQFYHQGRSRDYEHHQPGPANYY
jgi:hypothetical protein